MSGAGCGAVFGGPVSPAIYRVMGEMWRGGCIKYRLYGCGGMGMDPVTLIVTALAAGAVLGVSDTASAAVKDAYAALKALVKKRLEEQPDAELVLARHNQDPEMWRAPLMAKLGPAGAGSDPDLVAAAQAVMSFIDAGGARDGRYVVDVRGAQGVQIGDHNRQHNVFKAPVSGLVQLYVPLPRRWPLRHVIGVPGRHLSKSRQCLGRDRSPQGRQSSLTGEDRQASGRVVHWGDAGQRRRDAARPPLQVVGRRLTVRWSHGER